MSSTVEVDRDDPLAFEQLVAPHRRELLVHAYRMLGSTQDAEDAVQEALTAAWRGLGGLRSRAALRSWLYRVTTNAALRTAERRGPRMLSWERGAAADPRAELAPPLEDAGWIEPLREPAGDPEAAVLHREDIELAWIAALQHLPATQRAVLVLRDVLGFSAAETADILETTPASVNSALQRARGTLAAREPGRGRVDARGLDRGVVDAFVEAFGRGDVERVVELLAAEARFTMPPLTAWFDGRDDVAIFLTERVLATPWRVRRVGDVNGWPAVLGDQFWEGEWRPGALMILHGTADQIDWLATFVDPRLVSNWPEESKESATDR